MELIPILSTIILIGTIATFILAVGAYILYKRKERRQVKSSVPAVPYTIQAELYEPVKQTAETYTTQRYESQPRFNRYTGEQERVKVNWK